MYLLVIVSLGNYNICTHMHIAAFKQYRAMSKKNIPFLWKQLKPHICHGS